MPEIVDVEAALQSKREFQSWLTSLGGYDRGAVLSHFRSSRSESTSASELTACATRENSVVKGDTCERSSPALSALWFAAATVAQGWDWECGMNSDLCYESGTRARNSQDIQEVAVLAISSISYGIRT